jgi:antitoxin HicB
MQAVAQRRRDESCWIIEMSKLCYPIIVEPLSAEDGEGFVATVPDLPGCTSDGETPQEAFANLKDAIKAWIEAAKDRGHNVPQPTSRLR